MWLRVGAGIESIELGSLLSEITEKAGKKAVVIGSTDLTHYGSGYMFTPAGTGPEAVKWVKEVNDRRIIEQLTEMDSGAVIDLALRERSACSPGAAAAAVEFALEKGADCAKLVDYCSSFDVSPSSSFVGYAGVVYQER